jgi:hypothetical protein
MTAYRNILETHELTDAAVLSHLADRRAKRLSPWCWLGVCLILLAGSSAHGSGQKMELGHLQLGANVNEKLNWLLPGLMEQTHTTWVRGFVPAFEFMHGERSFNSDPGLLALKAAARSGHRVILSIKWDCVGRGEEGRVPDPGSSKEAQWFKFADDLLASTDGALSILVVDNELLIDTQREDLASSHGDTVPMVRFLQRLADHIAAEHPKAIGGGPLPIYAGGFTRLDREENRDNPATQQAIEWIDRDPNVTGADFHLHQPDMDTSESAMEFMRSRIPAKPLIVTEFSLVWKWKAHLGDRIGASPAGSAFAKDYGLPPQLTVAEFFTRAFQKRIPEAEWQAFLASQPWFEPNYLDEIGPRMAAHGIIVATYAFTLNPFPDAKVMLRPVTTDTVPWFVNDLLVPTLAYAPDSRRAPVTFGLYDSFVRWQAASAGGGQ